MIETPKKPYGGENGDEREEGYYGEIRKTIGTSLGTASGIVIGMIWTNVVLGAFTTAGIPLTTTGGTWLEWLYFVVVAIITTIIS